MKKDVRPQCRDRHDLREQRIGLAAQMYDAGASPDQIAEILKVTRQSVYSYLTETGRQCRGSRGEWKEERKKSLLQSWENNDDDAGKNRKNVTGAETPGPRSTIKKNGCAEDASVSMTPTTWPQNWSNTSTVTEPDRC